MTDSRTSSPHAEIEALGPWFHNLHLPDGTQTAPDHVLGDFPRFKWCQIEPHLPPRLDGWTVLDIGCNAGFYSIALAQRGARVTGIDADAHYLRQARWAATRFDIDDEVTFVRRTVYDLEPDRERYDLVLFMGVLYHLRYPQLGLDLAARVTGRTMVFQTLTMPGMALPVDTRGYGLGDREVLLHPGWPRMAFIEHELQDDPTNWWVPNQAAAEAMLRSAGLGIIARPGHEIYLCEPREGAWTSGDELRAATRGRVSAPSDGSGERP